MKYLKPPIGVAPSWFVCRKRIAELTEAIARYLKHIEIYNSTENQADYWKLIAAWSNEIKQLSLLMEELEREQK